MTAMATDTFELLDEDGRQLPGYLVSAGPAAVIVVHEVFGLNEQIKNVARRLARDANVTAFAVDLFEGRTTLDVATGYKMAQLLRWKTAIDVIRKARQALSDLGGGSRVGVMGFSFGGGVALAAAAHIPELAVCVPFYGIPTVEKADVTRIRGKVMGHFAKFDKHVSMQRVDALEQKLTEAGVAAEIFRYHADHMFFNEVRKPTHSQYNSDHAWHRTLAFLKRELLPGGGD
jgi:carboxymethylenebutenolidase